MILQGTADRPVIAHYASAALFEYWRYLSLFPQFGDLTGSERLGVDDTE